MLFNFFRIRLVERWWWHLTIRVWRKCWIWPYYSQNKGACLGGEPRELGKGGCTMPWKPYKHKAKVHVIPYPIQVPSYYLLLLLLIIFIFVFVFSCIFLPKDSFQFLCIWRNIHPILKLHIIHKVTCPVQENIHLSIYLSISMILI